MGKADSLSRGPDWEVGVEKDNENEMLVNIREPLRGNHCKGTSPSQPLNSMTTLRSYFSLFTSDT